MPEVHFTIRWPDGAEERCYSPSTVVRDFLATGAEYPLDEFVLRARGALLAASQRVALRHGRPCVLAAAQLRAIEAAAVQHAGGSVAILTMQQGDRL